MGGKRAAWRRVKVQGDRVQDWIEKTNDMKIRGILYSAAMVRAKVAGIKTQTRRIAKLNCSGRVFRGGHNWHVADANAVNACPYGQPGDVLYGKETFYVDYSTFADVGRLPKEKPDWADDNIYYRADGECCQIIPECCCAEVGKPKWRPSIFMPRWASRIVDEIVEVRLECLRDITEEGAIAEGIRPLGGNGPNKFTVSFENMSMNAPTAKEVYVMLWEAINGEGSWALNPWVWVIVTKPTDSPATVH